MRTLAHACALMCALSLVGSLPAQVAAGASKEVVDESAQALTNAMLFRVETAASVASGTVTPAAAIDELRAHNSPTGLKIDSDADFAFAAIDVGRRLIAAHKPLEAEAFFRAADESLGLVIERTADAAARDKVQYLQQRALIRADYLNKLTEARADLDAALKLTPADKHLQQMRNLLPADPASTLQNHKEQPSKG